MFSKCVMMDWFIYNQGGGPTPTPMPANAYVEEDGITPYVGEDGVTYYVQET